MCPWYMLRFAGIYGTGLRYRPGNIQTGTGNDPDMWNQAHKAEYMRIAWAGSGTPDGGLPAPGAPGCPEGKYEEVIWVREKDREGITRL